MSSGQALSGSRHAESAPRPGIGYMLGGALILWIGTYAARSAGEVFKNNRDDWDSIACQLGMSVMILFLPVAWVGDYFWGLDKFESLALTAILAALIGVLFPLNE